MKNKLMFLFIATFLFGITSAFAEDKASPTMQAKWEEMKKYTEPNEHHKALEPLVGRWKTTVKIWMTEGAEPEISEGTSDNQWIMGGRFLQQNFRGEAMGKPFEGMGIIGYDTIAGEYTSLWLDNMSTGIMRGTAQFDSSSKTFTEKGTMSCPMTMEKDREMRAEWKIIDNNRSTYETFLKDKDGKEFKSMEITYDRML